ncbi:hydrolase [Actinokineospora sp. NBRC 105648]|nr:hydrolase [Actinokineospora sp. NBRC 105648]
MTAAVTIGAVAAIVAGAVPAAATAPDGVPRIDWRQCPDDTALQCAGVQVPLDYTRPRGRKITVRLVKRPADDQRHKTGTLFINNGGPGGSAADFVPTAAEVLGAGTRTRFDVVGIDPRGIGGTRNCVTEGCGSTPVTCTPRPGDPPGPAAPEILFPVSRDEIRAWLTYGDYVRGLCARTGNEIINHMSTADTARDMDLMRRAVGDRKLTYYGISYGSMLGATYAAMYPDKIRALIVDGVIDPVQWTTGRGNDSRYLLSARINSGAGAWETLQSALTECDRAGTARCAFAGSPGKTAQQKYDAVIERLKREPLETPEGPITYQYAVGVTHSALTIFEVYPQLMQVLESTYQALFNTTAKRATSVGWHDLKVKPGAPTLGAEPMTPSFHGVACADSVNPTDRGAGVRSAAYADRTGPGFGSLWSWLTSTCQNWPGSARDAFRGPWNVRTSAPLLIANPVHDPSTPISGAYALHDLMPNSRLLEVDVWSHGAIGVTCAQRVYEKYLVDLKLPARGQRCAADGPLFP